MRKKLTKDEKKVLIPLWVKGKYEKTAKKDVEKLDKKYNK